MWTIDVQQLSKLRTYRVFKTEFKCEDYVKLNVKKCKRSVLCQFRTGILPLRVETGRYVGEPADQRYCTLCTPDVPMAEDERHFLFNCTIYNNLREKLLYLLTE